MTNCLGHTALHFCYEFGYYGLAEYLVRKGANPNIRNYLNLKASEGINKKHLAPIKEPTKINSRF